MMENPIPKYQYHVQTWGGFYNEEHREKHGLDDGDFLFYSESDRTKFCDDRRAVEEELNARDLMFRFSEGYYCDARTILHRITEYDGKKYYSTLDMGINVPISSAKFSLQWKWRLGFNDYPLGNDFDYENNNIKTTEWITGAFEFTPEE